MHFYASEGYECIYQLSIACKCTDRRSLDRYRIVVVVTEAYVCLTAGVTNPVNDMRPMSEDVKRVKAKLDCVGQ